MCDRRGNAQSASMVFTYISVPVLLNNGVLSKPAPQNCLRIDQYFEKLLNQLPTYVVSCFADVTSVEIITTNTARWKTFRSTPMGNGRWTKVPATAAATAAASLEVRPPLFFFFFLE